MTPQEKSAMDAENARLRQQLAERLAEIESLQRQSRRADHSSYAERLIDAGILAPKNRELVVALLEFADSGEALEFGEGDAKRPLCDAVKNFLAEQPKVIEFGEIATRDRAVSAADAYAVQPVKFDAPRGFKIDAAQLARHSQVVSHARRHGLSYEHALDEIG